MNATKPIGARGDDIRGRLAAAAFELFRTKGFSSTTVDDIVELANGKWTTVSGWVTIPAGVIPSS